MSEVEKRAIAEALRLRRAPHDPLRAVAAADSAGLRLRVGEPEVFRAAVDLLDLEGTVTLDGEPEPRARLLALLLGDGLARGGRRFLWVGPRPRAVDRAAARSALPLHEVRAERGAYDGEGLFGIAAVTGAPPGLGRAAAFDGVFAPLDDDVPATGPAVRVGPGGLRTLPDRRGEAAVVAVAEGPAAREARAVLDEALAVLDPAPLGELARAAARGSTAALVATLRRLETRLGRMVRAHRAQRSDDGLETAEQLCWERGAALGDPDRDAILAALSLQTPRRALEDERERLASLRAAAEAEGDPAVDALVGTGARLLVVASRAAQEAARARLPAAAAAEDVVERLEQARDGAVAVVRDDELRSARVDRVMRAGLPSARLDDGGATEADTLVSLERDAREGVAPPAAELACSAEAALWRDWCAALELQAPPTHPDAASSMEAALAGPTELSLGHLADATGARLFALGDAPEGIPGYPDLAEALFAEGRALLPTATARLDRALGAARSERALALAAFARAQDAAAERVAEAERKTARALSADERTGGEQSIHDAREAAAALDATPIEDAYRRARTAALVTFATPPTLDATYPVDGDGQGRGTVLRILHTADWHLGRRHRSLPEPARHTLARSRYETVERILALGTRLEVDAVLCAGDLFDEPDPDEAVTAPLAELLETTRVPVVLLPGNHDPVNGSRSPWHPDHAFRRRLPATVHVVDRDDFELAVGPGVVVATPCRSTAGAAPITARLAARPDGDERPRVGLAHGSTFADDVPFPVGLDGLDALGLDLLALGDHHGLAIHEGATTVAYPGTPEPTRFGEHGAGHVVLATVGRGAVRCVPERVQRWRWRDETVRSVAELAALTETDLDATVLRLTLSGTLTPNEHARLERLLGVLERRVEALVVRREDLRLDLARGATPLEGLPELLRDAGQQLLGDARQGDAVAERALRHLFRLVAER
ncbi:MAG: hypothetical protein CMN30_04920 [Sandaracinus sp.]|nr:hypothetical protein [Sandaracinus sp.]